MKKIFTIVLTICMLASVLCVPTFAAESNTIMVSVSGLKEDGTIIGLNHWTEFADGWEAAVDFACDEDFMEKNGYIRIVVDFRGDWNANENGEFGKSSWTGFQYSTIYVPDDVRITLNLNGHTINRTLKEWEHDGEVIYIDEDADVIINDGTISGGWSCNGAGGIYIDDGANVTLNNINIVGNKVDDADGAGIAVYNGATLTMNGGCVSRNVSYNSVRGGGVFIDEASANFKGVTFQDNQGIDFSTLGVVVYVEDGTVDMEDCEIVGNGLTKASNGDTCQVAYSIIDISSDSNVTMKNTRFLDNGYAQEIYVERNTLKYTTVINSVASYLTMEKCTFNDNNQVYLIQSEATVLNAVDSDFTQNNSFAFYGNCANGSNNRFTSCKFSYNDPVLKLDDTFFFNISNSGLTFLDCDLGEATFNNKNAAQFVDTKTLNSDKFPASIFGEGSLVIIVAFTALMVSVISLVINIFSKKSKVQDEV